MRTLKLMSTLGLTNLQYLNTCYRLVQCLLEWLGRCLEFVSMSYLLLGHGFLQVLDPLVVFPCAL